MRNVGTWSWRTWLCAVALVCCCGPCLGLCFAECTFDIFRWKYGLVQEVMSLVNPAGYMLLDLEGEQGTEEIARILRREMLLA